MIDSRLSQNETNVCQQPCRVLCPDARTLRVNVLVSLLVTSILFMSVSVSAAPRISAGHSSNLRLANIGGTVGYRSNSGSQITQMAFGPGPDVEKTYLYTSSNQFGIRRMEYNAVSGVLSNRVYVDSTAGNGIAFHRRDMYLSEGYRGNASGKNLTQFKRLTDGNENGVYNEGGASGDKKINIVQGIPRDDHGLNHIQFIDDTLYVGNGTRNGAFQSQTGDTFGESDYGDAMLMIENVTLMSNVTDAAGFFPGNPSLNDYRNLINGIHPDGAHPFTSTAQDKLGVHSSGTRNPFGVTVDGD